MKRRPRRDIQWKHLLQSREGRELMKGRVGACSIAQMFYMVRYTWPTQLPLVVREHLMIDTFMRMDGGTSGAADAQSIRDRVS